MTSEADTSAASSSHLLVGSMCRLGRGKGETAAKAPVPTVLLTSLKKDVGNAGFVHNQQPSALRKDSITD